MGNTKDEAAEAQPETRLFAGFTTVCALKRGVLKCFGYNGQGALGRGDCHAIEPDFVPPGPLPFTPTMAAVGAYHTCASDGATTACWGRNVAGEIGHAPIPNSTVGCPSDAEPKPTIVLDLPSIDALSAGFVFSCALHASGVRCWGAPGAQLGVTAAPGVRVGLPPSLIANTEAAKELGIGQTFGCVRKTSGKVACWGQNFFGQLAQPATTEASTSALDVELPGTAIQLDVSRTGWNACALLSDHTVSCWGMNRTGQAGHPPSEDPNCGSNIACTRSPTSVRGLSQVRSLGVGYKHACAVLLDGGVTCWGQNAQGELGHSPALDPTMSEDTKYNATPQRVAGLPPAVQVVGGSRRTCAVTRDDRVFCWGRPPSDITNATVAPTPTPIAF